MKARACAFVLALAFLLGGCNGSTVAPEPKDTFTPSESSDSPTATESTDAGPVEPTLPEAAKARTDRGAKSFIKYFFAVVDYAQATGDTELLSRLGSATCSTCEGGLNWIHDVYAAGGQIKGGEHTVGTMTVDEPPSGPSGRIVDVRVDVERTVVGGAGELNKRYPAGSNHYVFTLIYSHGEWQAGSWDFV